MDSVLLVSRVFMAGQILAVIFSFIILVKIAKRNTRDREQNSAILTKDAEEPEIAIAEAKIDSLGDELKKAKASYAVVQNELQDLKKKKIV